MLGVDHLWLRLLFLPATHAESFKQIINAYIYVPVIVVCIYLAIRLILAHITLPTKVHNVILESKQLFKKLLGKITAYVHIDTIKWLVLILLPVILVNFVLYILADFIPNCQPSSTAITALNTLWLQAISLTTAQKEARNILLWYTWLIMVFRFILWALIRTLSRWNKMIKNIAVCMYIIGILVAILAWSISAIISCSV